jgi:hypothetical protein
MQTNTARGMQTMEQALGDLVMRGVVRLDEALTRSSRADQLIGLLDRSGFDVSGALASGEAAHPQPGQPLHQPVSALRVAGS